MESDRSDSTVEAELCKLRLMHEIDRRAIDRWVPCPDHRDKTDPGRCYVCENERLRAGLEWILDNIDHQKAPLIVGRARMALRV